MSLPDRFDAYLATRALQFALLIFAAAAVIVGGLMGALTIAVLVVFGVGVDWYHYAIIAHTAGLSALIPASDAYQMHPKGGALLSPDGEEDAY